MSLDLTFREATSADAQAIAQLVEEAYRGPSGRQGWTQEAHLVEGQRTSREDVAELLAASHRRFVLAFHGRELVGSCLLEHHDGAVSLGMLSVRPALQRGGVGRALLAEAEQRAFTHWRAARVDIHVLEQDARLVSWYQDQGYEDTGVRFPFQPPKAVARQELNFAAMAKNLPARAAAAPADRSPAR